MSEPVDLRPLINKLDEVVAQLIVLTAEVKKVRDKC